MTRMKYSEFIENIDKNQIVNVSDETVEKAIFDWFKYRYIGFDDPDKFLDILRRNIAVNYPIYSQKLRIQPGISHYDWLVQTYRERQLKTTGGTKNTQIRGNDKTTRTPDLYDYDYDEITTTTDMDSNITKKGSEKHVKSGGHKDSREKYSDNVHDEFIEGSHISEYSPHVAHKTQNGGDFSAWSGDSQIRADLPMSKSYKSSEMIEPDNASDDKQQYQKAYQHMPALDWQTATSQGQNGHREYRNDDTFQTTSYEYDKSGKGDITKREGSKESPDTRTTKTDHGAQSNIFIYNDETDTVTFEGRSDNTHNGGKVKVSAPHHHGNETTENVYGNIANTGLSNSINRERESGRSIDIATLLDNATSFIERSSAWKWLKEQLEPCFAPWYDDEDGGLI